MTLFDWLKELTGKKRDWDSFSDKERESFNPYMVNRFLSMHEPFVELVNYVQTIPYTEKRWCIGCWNLGGDLVKTHVKDVIDPEDLTKLFRGDIDRYLNRSFDIVNNSSFRVTINCFMEEQKNANI